MAYYGPYINARGPLRGIDRALIDAVYNKDKKPKTIYASYPCMVDSINMYYKQEWMTGKQFLELRNRFGKACKILKIRKVKQ